VTCNAKNSSTSGPPWRSSRLAARCCRRVGVIGTWPPARPLARRLHQERRAHHRRVTSTRRRACARHGVLLMVDDWIERFVAARIAEHEARLQRRQAERAAMERQRQDEALRRQQDLEERARLLEQRKQPCGAKTRAGRPCRRKGLGKGGRCANHGGESTGPRTEAGKQRISTAQRARWMQQCKRDRE
jgi:hypothetical protein